MCQNAVNGHANIQCNGSESFWWNEFQIAINNLAINNVSLTQANKTVVTQNKNQVNSNVQIPNVEEKFFSTSQF
jgi:hypothetical protein